MCLIAFAANAHPDYPFVLIGNRDEFHARPASAAGFQPDAPQVYGGRDLEKQGSWLQVSAHGRLAAVTNVRDGLAAEPAARSRGDLVTRAVRDEDSASVWLDQLAPHAAAYGRFNLLLWDGDATRVASNHPAWSDRRVADGVHGLSNGAFETDWPKVRRARDALADWIAARETDPTLLYAALADEQRAPDDQLPDTGVPLDLERSLSPPFIRNDRYGTRCSSLVLIGHDAIRFLERRFGPDGVPLGESDTRFARR